MTNDHTNDNNSKMAGDPSGDSIPLRSERNLDNPKNSESYAPSKTGGDPQSSNFNKLDEKDFSLAQYDNTPIVTQENYNHPHLPINISDKEIIAALKKIKADIPELYQVCVDSLQKGVDADYIQRTYPYTEPLKNVNSGRKYGLAAFITIMFLSAYALYLGHAWFASIISFLDIAGLVAVFAYNPSNNEQQ